MPDDSMRPADKAVLAFFEIVAFALGWGGVDRVLDGKSWLSVLPIFAATILTSYTGFKWPQIKATVVGNRLGASGQYRSILAVVALLLLTAYDIHDRHVSGSPTLIPWWHYGPIVLGVAAVIWLLIGGLPRKKLSKLVIHWANYRATENNGDVYEVDDFLRQIISGDSLVFDIENHNFVIGDKNFVPHDPLPFKPKRLQVNYSYRGQPALTIVRYEHGRLVLPEDSVIQWLTNEIDRLKAALPKQSQYPIPEVRLKILSIVSELQGFLGEHGEEPRPPEVHKELGEENEDFLVRFRARPIEPMMKWRAKFLGDYRQEFKDKVSRLRDEMRSRARIDDSLLNIAIDRAENERNDGVAAVQGVIKRFWELALKVNV